MIGPVNHTMGDRLSGALSRGLTNSSTADTFADLSPTTTLPASIDTAATVTTNSPVFNGGRRWLCLAPFGTNAADEAFEFRVWGWNKCGTLWVPFLLSSCTATLGSDTGVASATITDDEYFADTIVESDNPDAIAGTMFTGEGENVPMMVVIDTAGFQMLQVTFDRSTAASANVAYRLM